MENKKEGDLKIQFLGNESTIKHNLKRICIKGTQQQVLNILTAKCVKRQ